MSKKFDCHFEDIQINNPDEGVWRPCVVKVYGEGIEVELWKMVTHRNSVVIHKKTKSFDFQDLLVMNEVINRIYGKRT